MDEFSKNILVHEIKLDVKKKMIGHADHLDFWVDEVRRGAVIDQLILRMTRDDLFKEKVDVLKFPKDLWQHFKLKFFPGWLERKFPVRYTYYNAEIYFVDEARLAQKLGASTVAFAISDLDR